MRKLCTKQWDTIFDFKCFAILGSCVTVRYVKIRMLVCKQSPKNPTDQIPTHSMSLYLAKLKQIWRAKNDRQATKTQATAVRYV